MVSPREMELVAETRIEEWRRDTQLAEHRARIQRELALLDMGPARPVLGAIAVWLRGRLPATTTRGGNRGSALSKPGV